MTAWRAVTDSSSARREAADRYRPGKVDLLLVAEAPPRALERYFYFPNVSAHDSLFRCVVRSVLSREPTRDKAQFLEQFRAAGIFLIDVCEDPLNDESDLRRYVPDLIRRVCELAPAHIILIKATVYDAAYWPLKQAGLPVVDVRIPFPGSGRQLEFERWMTEALSDIGWVAPNGEQA